MIFEYSSAKNGAQLSKQEFILSIINVKQMFTSIILSAVSSLIVAGVRHS